MRRWWSAVVAVLLGAAVATPVPPALAATEGAYAVTDLGSLEPGGSVGPLAVDDAGRVAGVASVGTSLRGFLHDGVAMRELPPLPGHTETSAHDLSDSGIAVGTSSGAGGVDSTPVRWDGTSVRELPLPVGATAATALGVSDDGTVVGSATTADGAHVGVRWRAGEVEVLDEVLPLPAGARVDGATRVDDAGRMIGRMWLATGEPVAFWFDAEVVHEVRLGAELPADAVAFGPSGVAATAGGDQAFLWRDGATVPLPALAGDSCTAAADLDVDGRVVGRSSACGRDPSPRAVLWQGGRAVDLQSLLPAGTGWRLVDARAIARGRIAAVAVDAEGRSRAVLLTPQPSLEPVAGADATATALAVARTVAPGQRATAVLAAETSAADVAVAAVLAAHLRAPLLLTSPDHLDARVEEALGASVHPGGTVALVGGPAALSVVVEARLGALGHPVLRHAGVDRHETAVRVAEAIGGPGRAVLVSGEAFDAPAAVPVAVHDRAALLWTEGSTLPAATRRYLEARPGWPRTAIGRAAGADPAAVVLRGIDRTETAVLVARASFPWPPVVTVAPADRPVEGALAGWAASGAAGPVLVAFDRLPTLSGGYLAGLPFLPGFRTIGPVSPGVAEQLAPSTG